MRASNLSFLAWLALAAVACAGPEERPKVPATHRGTSIEVSNLEIHADGVDRFASCAPPGELGQAWYPMVPEWTAPPPAGDAGAPPGDAPGALVDDGSGRSVTERAVEDTRAAFRSCYHRGLIHDPTQDGRAAVVLRVGRDGRVAKTESYGVCELQIDVVKCMRETAARLRFAPSPGGETIVLPVVFAPRGGSQSETTANDSYTAAAYVAVEALRPELHACEEQARGSGRGVEAWGVFDMKIDAAGRTKDANVDPWGGDQDLLACAVRVLQTLKLEPPVGGGGNVVVRVSFNPRAGSR